MYRKDHYRFLAALKGMSRKRFTFRQIQKIMSAQFPHYAPSGVLPNDHDQNVHIGSCPCAGTEDRIFDRVARGQFEVRSKL